MLGVLAQVKADKDSIEVLVQPVETADRLFQEIQTWLKQVDDLEYKLDFRGQAVRTMEEIQSELNTLQSTKYISSTYPPLVFVFSQLCDVDISFSHNLFRDGLHNELEKLRDEQRYMENDLSNIQLRWHNAREEKVIAANTLRNVKKAEEELERLTEEKSQVDLDVKVACPSNICVGITYLICQISLT